MNYFFDENFAPPIVRAIRKLHGRDHPQDIIESSRDRDYLGFKDLPWIEALVNTQTEWTILTLDQMRNERYAVQNSGFTWFIFSRSWASLRFWDQSWKLIKVWPDIAAESERSHGRVFTVTANGKINRA